MTRTIAPPLNVIGAIDYNISRPKRLWILIVITFDAISMTIYFLIRPRGHNGEESSRKRGENVTVGIQLLAPRPVDFSATKRFNYS